MTGAPHFDQAQADRQLALRLARARWVNAEPNTPEKAEARRAYESALIADGMPSFFSPTANEGKTNADRS